MSRSTVFVDEYKNLTDSLFLLQGGSFFTIMIPQGVRKSHYNVTFIGVHETYGICEAIKSDSRYIESLSTIPGMSFQICTSLLQIIYVIFFVVRNWGIQCDIRVTRFRRASRCGYTTKTIKIFEVAEEIKKLFIRIL